MLYPGLFNEETAAEATKWVLSLSTWQVEALTRHVGDRADVLIAQFEDTPPRGEELVAAANERVAVENMIHVINLHPRQDKGENEVLERLRDFDRTQLGLSGRRAGRASMRGYGHLSDAYAAGGEHTPVWWAAVARYIDTRGCRIDVETADVAVAAAVHALSLDVGVDEDVIDWAMWEMAPFVTDNLDVERTVALAERIIESIKGVIDWAAEESEEFEDVAYVNIRDYAIDEVDGYADTVGTANDPVKEAERMARRGLGNLLDFQDGAI
jgi:hypothetical protein